MYATKFNFEPANENSPESVHDNVFWQGAAPRLSICVPSFRTDCSDLIGALARCKQGSLAEIIIYDDGSQDHVTLAKMQYEAGCVPAAVPLPVMLRSLMPVRNGSCCWMQTCRRSRAISFRTIST